MASITPDPHRPIVRAIRAQITNRGIRAAARILGLDRDTVTAYQRGARIREGTALQVEQRAQAAGWLGAPADLDALSRATGTPVAQLRRLRGAR